MENNIRRLIDKYQDILRKEVDLKDHQHYSYLLDEIDRLRSLERELVLREILVDLKELIGRIKRGDRVGEAFSGTIGIIADIQYEHNRYQFEHTSGWRYGIENITKLD